MNSVADLDSYAGWIMTHRKIPDPEKRKIIAAIDVVQNSMEDLKW
jgi:hypothetical protein